MICDKPEPVVNFDGAAYMRTWYTAAHSRGMPFQPDGWTCTTATYSDLEGRDFKLYNSSENQHHQGPFGVHGTAEVSLDGTGSIAVSISYPAFAPNYFVVDTDYENYSIVYNCDEKDGIVFLWYLTRKEVATFEELDKYDAITHAKMPHFDTFNDLLHDY